MRAVMALIVTVLIGIGLGGCANFGAIKAFAKDGSTVAAAAKKDVETFSTSCADLRAEAAVLAYAGGATSVTQDQSSTCKNVTQAAGVAAESLSVQLLVKYHEALNALAGDENWTIATEVEALGAAVKKVKVDGKALSSDADVARYQGAFTAAADLIASALREREAKRLLGQPLDWPEALRPLRFWYGGKDGTSFYSEACRLIKTEWALVQSELMDYARCERRAGRTAPACEPLTAAIRLAAIDEKIKPLTACAPRAPDVLPDASVARVKLIDSWIEANEELRRKAFEKDPKSLLERLAALRDQAEVIKKAFD